MYEVIFLFILIFIIIVIIESYEDKKQKTEMLSKVKDFDSKSLFNTNYNYLLSVNKEKKKLSLVVDKYGKISQKIYSFNDILELEIIENGSSLTKTSRSSQLGGTLIGALALGGVGAVIGGLSGGKHQIDKINKLDLKITVNDIDNPMIIIDFLNEKNGYDKNGLIYKSILENIREWESLLRVVIKQADEEDNKKEQIDNNIQTKQELTLSDELRKLKSLLDDEILTKEEFEEQKAKLLSKE